MLLSRIRPIHLMIFGLVAMAAGLLVFALWKVDGLGDWDIAGTHIVRWFRKTLGRYGVSSLYFFGGLIILLRGYVALRVEERSRKAMNEQSHLGRN